MSHRNWTVGGIVLIVTLIAVMIFASAYTALQAINPLAALTAALVALIGIVWFKKTAS